MSGNVTKLDQLQRWMLDAVTNPDAPVADRTEQIISPSDNQSSAERLNVYRNAYLARLLEVLRELFPCTRFAVDDDLFDQFAADYLRAHPPHSYTLGRLSDNLVEYLDGTRPADWGAFVVELASLEQAIDRVFDAPGPEGLPPLALPASVGESLTLTFVPGFELLAFDFPVSSYYTDWKAGQQPTWPERRPQFVALFRRDYVVRRHDLSAEQHELLLILRRGSSLGEALAVAADKVALDAAEVQQWFADWAERRFFASAVVAS